MDYLVGPIFVWSVVAVVFFGGVLLLRFFR